MTGMDGQTGVEYGQYTGMAVKMPGDARRTLPGPHRTLETLAPKERIAVWAPMAIGKI